MNLYRKINIGLTTAQVKRLQRAIESNKPITFTKYNVTGNVPIYLTQAQVAKLGVGPLKLGVRQLAYMSKQGGFLGALLKLIGPAVKAILPVAKTVAKIAGPAAATGAITAAANYGTRKALEGKRGRGLEIKPYNGGNVNVEITLTPQEVNALRRVNVRPGEKRGGFLGVLASLAASLLPAILGNGLSKSEIAEAKDIIISVAQQKTKKAAEQELKKMARKYGNGLLGKLFNLPGGKVPVLGDIPLLKVLF